MRARNNPGNNFNHIFTRFVCLLFSSLAHFFLILDKVKVVEILHVGLVLPVICKRIVIRGLLIVVKVMSVVVRNLQRSVPLNVKRLRNHVSILMNLFDIESYSLGVICMSKSQIKHLNKVYCNIDGSTDVLSFPNHVSLNLVNRKLSNTAGKA